MRTAPSFWWRADRNPIAWGLLPIAGLYGLASAYLMTRDPRERASVPVICVGNFVVGGSGKTPTALALAEVASRQGLRPGFLTRGYGGREAGPLAVDLTKHGPEQVGDEALLLADAAPTVVAHDRPAGAARLAESSVDLIIMVEDLRHFSGRHIVLGQPFNSCNDRVLVPAVVHCSYCYVIRHVILFYLNSYPVAAKVFVLHIFYQDRLICYRIICV